MSLSRRSFLQTSLAGAAALPAVAQDHDSYGGWAGKKFRKTGYFRLEKDERWWMVSPEGNAFLAFGANHLHASWWKGPTNGRHWAAQFGVSDPSDPAFDGKLRQEMARLLPSLGFNHIGVHADFGVLNTPQPIMPYIPTMMLLDIPHWGTPTEKDFRDVFAPAFEAHAMSVARREVAPRREDPLLLGYAMTDCPIFTDWDAKERGDTIYGAPRRLLPTFPRWLRNLDAAQPGKQAYVDTMRELYRDSIADFNVTYETSFRSFSDLADAVNWRHYSTPSNANETRDNTAFLLKVVDRYYQVARDAIRRYDENHLFFGDKLNGNTDTADTVVSVTSKYTDMVFYQAYGRYDWMAPSLDRWSKASGKPLFNGDGSYGVSTPKMPRPYGPLANDHGERAAWTLEFAEHAFARPDFVGWTYCGLIDTWTTLSARKALRQHAGMMSPTGEYHGPMRDVVGTIAKRLYEIGAA